MLNVWTAQYRYPGPDRLDITVKGKDKLGRYFAPSWEMVQNLKKGKITQDEYLAMYHVLISNLYKTRPEIFQALLSREQVILVCFCAYGDFCHRFVLADYLKQLGATYHGEITDFEGLGKKPKVIDKFKGPYHWLSNFAHCKFTHNHQQYQSVEHFYQAQKADSHEMITIKHPTNEKQNIHVNAREYIATCNNPKKTVRKYKVQLPEYWEDEKLKIMRTGLEYKFIANPHFRKLLAETDNATIIEGNTWHDNFWGDCRCHSDPTAHWQKDICAEPGKNVLGQMIMKIREIIQ